MASDNRNKNQDHRIDRKIKSPLHRKPFDRMSTIDANRTIGRRIHRKPFDRMTFGS
jgi:PIN domain nuclease of toxin-antitoxin system